MTTPADRLAEDGTRAPPVRGFSEAEDLAGNGCVAALDNNLQNHCLWMYIRRYCYR